MNRIIKSIILFAGLIATAGVSSGQNWRAVQDPSGITWGRIRIVNESANVSNWSISNCRPAVSSTETVAVTSQELNWDGVVHAGETYYVWVYGVAISTVNIANADGGASAYVGEHALASDGDGELVITIAADGAVTTMIESASYIAPNYSGDFDPTK